MEQRKDSQTFRSVKRNKSLSINSLQGVKTNQSNRESKKQKNREEKQEESK